MAVRELRVRRRHAVSKIICVFSENYFSVRIIFVVVWWGGGQHRSRVWVQPSAASPLLTDSLTAGVSWGCVAAMQGSWRSVLLGKWQPQTRPPDTWHVSLFTRETLSEQWSSDWGENDDFVDAANDEHLRLEIVEDEIILKWNEKVCTHVQWLISYVCHCQGGSTSTILYYNVISISVTAGASNLVTLRSILLNCLLNLECCWK